MSKYLSKQSFRKKILDHIANWHGVLGRAFYMKFKRITKGIYNKYNRYQLYRKNKAVLARNLALAGKFSGNRCFILGTGPSINEQDILKLKNEQTFVVNTFWKHPDYKEFNPKHYAFIDTKAFLKDESQNNYFKEQFINSASFLRTLPTKFFFHIDGKDMIEDLKLFPKEQVYYLAPSGFFKEKLNFNIDISRVIPNPKNVIIACIIVAVYMGFKEIYLLGCEHDFLAYPSNFEWNKHFYKTEDFNMNNLEDVKKYALQITSYEELINDAKSLFTNYRLLNAKIKSIGPEIKIFNATPNSFLDVFPRIKFENIRF